MHRRNLPHFRRAGATYFITWRLIRTQPELTPVERTVVTAALHHFDGLHYNLIAFVVMTDHVHVLTTPLNGRSLESLAHSWKSYTAHKIQRMSMRDGRIWQQESFDRIPRSEEELQRLVSYVRNNPRKRWPWESDYPWLWVSGDVGV
jgi:putative DNA methylase